ncbi:putative steryl acetyl hydrolase mug81, partial [Oleoguttula sp. CCFEE 5521]
MSPSVDTAATQWLDQLAAMRAAIAELKLPQANGASKSGNVEHDLDFDDDDLSPASGSDDIWDIISDEDEGDFTDDSFEAVAANASNNGFHVDAVGSKEWLEQRCIAVASRGSGMDAETLLSQITAVLASDSSDDELQMTLADILGFAELELVADIIKHRKQILSEPTKVPSGLLTKAERDARLRQQDLEHKTATLATAQDRSASQYPHVYRAHDAGNSLSAAGRKYMLPVGSERIEREKYEQYSIPAAKVGVLGQHQKLVEISEMDGLCRGTFKGYKSLNRMQSLVYPVAYTTSENMLICAPTGAGKTDAAMLTILSAVAKNITPSPIDEPDATDFAVRTDDFKVVYVAPMKALAAEITDKLGRRLAWLGIRVRELTGDMHLTKSEIVQTQIIVTTPEKWDV